MLKKSILNISVLLTLFNCSVAQKTVAQSDLNVSQVKASMVKALEWQEAHPIFAISPTDWTAGAYYTGVAKAHQATKDQVYMAALKNQGYWNKWETYTRLHHADDIAISYSYLYIDMATKRKNFVDLAPTKKFIDAHLYEDDIFKAGKDKSAAGKTILWWWCDALFMAPPVINLYAKHTKNTKYLDDMHKFYTQTYNQLYDKEERLFARDMRFVWKGNKKDRKEPNGKKIFWSRGNGWVLGGLALILDDMPKDCPETYNHGEVSGSGFYTYALAWGINNGVLDKATYLPAVKKAWNALAKCQHEDGKIGWVQNIGAFPEPASQGSWQNFGTGAYLLAGSEVIKLNK